MEFSSYIDISPMISAKTAVFPGDKAFSRTVSMSFSDGHHLGLSEIATTLHIGAHADAPSHYHPEGISICSQELSYYLGGCQVIRVQIPCGARILPADLGGIHITQKRVLFRTDSFNNPDVWQSDFNSLSPELIDFLADAGVSLIGIDTPSIDPANSKALESHSALYRRGLANLEGLVLNHVADGEYFLSALPLKIKSGDASPVRAVLFSKMQNF